MRIFSCPSSQQMNANICWAEIRIGGGSSKGKALHWGMCLWNTNLLISLKGSGSLSPQCDTWNDHTAMWAHTHTMSHICALILTCTNIMPCIPLHIIGWWINGVCVHVYSWIIAVSRMALIQLPSTMCLHRSASHLTHASDAWHNGVVKEIELLSRFTEEEVNLIIIADCVAFGQTLLNVGWAHKSGICGRNKNKCQSTPWTVHRDSSVFK